MNKAEIVDRLTERLGDKKVATAALEGLLDIVERGVAKGEKVTITGFGSFEKSDRPARVGRNPQTGEKVKIKKTSVPKFKAGARLKNVANGTVKLGREPKHEPLLPAGVTTLVSKIAAQAPAPPAKKAAAKKAPAKKAPATKKAAPAAKKPATAKKAPATSKPAPATTKKAAPSTKKAPATTKKATPAAKKTATAKKTPAKTAKK